MIKKSFSNLQSSVLVASIIFGMSACSSRHQADPAIASAATAIQQAESSPAPRYAPEELAAARQKWNRAKFESQDGDLQRARRLGEEAAVDAQYAEAKAEALRLKSLR